MFVPPKSNIDLTNLYALIQKLDSQKQLDYDILLQYLNLKPNRIGQADVSDLIIKRADLYLNKIEGQNLPQFLYTYYLTIQNNPTKQVIFLAMFLAAKKRYPEMMTFQKLISNDQVLSVYNQLIA